MISQVELQNLIAWSAQTTVIVIAAALLSRTIRIDAPGVRYGYWRAVGLLCIILPWLQTARRSVTGATGSTDIAVTAIVAAVSPAAIRPVAHVDWTAAAVIVIALGAVVRLVWVAAGLFELRRLRARARHDADATAGMDLQETLGTRAEVCYAPALPQPVTFGFRRPVILLPAHLREQPVEIQRAVLGHELLHVQRRDWAWLIAEEIARAALWFHPAAWWLISRIQLAREEAVDELAVMLTGRRKVYVEALLAFSDSSSLVPTAAFAHRRHLFRRITLVSKEVAMSSGRIVASCATMALVLAAGSWYAVAAFPLQQASTVVRSAPGPLERKAHAVTPENPVPRRVSSEAMTYPSEAAAADAHGDITLTVTLDELGRVAEVRPTAIGIRAAVLDLRGRVEVSENLRDKFKSMVTGSGDKSASTMGMFDAVTRAAADAVQQWRYDPPFQAPIAFPVTLTFGSERTQRDSAAGALSIDTQTSRSSDGKSIVYQPRTPGIPVTGSASVREPLRVGGGIKTPMKIKDVKPAYPPIAKDSGVQGVVIIEVRVESDGRVGDMHVLRSIPLLDQAALDAVGQWEFTPTLLNGEPVPIIMTVTVNFTLSQ